tara:strand:- start:283 stop:495 length:213 start_codon:yes stop_codon:yes gene_type:complete
MNVFETEKEALEASEYDYLKFKEYHSSNKGYLNKTKRWAIPKKRDTDSLWIYEVCPNSDAVYSVESSEDI